MVIFKEESFWLRLVRSFHTTYSKGQESRSSQPSLKCGWISDSNKVSEDWDSQGRLEGLA